MEGSLKVRGVCSFRACLSVRSGTAGASASCLSKYMPLVRTCHYYMIAVPFFSHSNKTIKAQPAWICHRHSSRPLQTAVHTRTSNCKHYTELSRKHPSCRSPSMSLGTPSCLASAICHTHPALPCIPLKPSDPASKSLSSSSRSRHEGLICPVSSSKRVQQQCFKVSNGTSLYLSVLAQQHDAAHDVPAMGRPIRRNYPVISTFSDLVPQRFSAYGCQHAAAPRRVI